MRNRFHELEDKSVNRTLRKVPKFHLISWCGNFKEMHSFAEFRAYRPKICGNNAFPQNFYISKLDESSVFYTVTRS